MEMTSNKEILVCLGMCNSQPTVNSQFINYEMNMVFFKGGVNPTSIGSLTFEEVIKDNSFVSLLPLEENNAVVIAVFGDCLFVVGLITPSQKCELVLIRKITMLDKSRLD